MYLLSVCLNRLPEKNPHEYALIWLLGFFYTTVLWLWLWSLLTMIMIMMFVEVKEVSWSPPYNLTDKQLFSISFTKWLWEASKPPRVSGSEIVKKLEAIKVRRKSNNTTSWDNWHYCRQKTIPSQIVIYWWNVASVREKWWKDFSRCSWIIIAYWNVAQNRNLLNEFYGLHFSKWFLESANFKLLVVIKKSRCLIAIFSVAIN